MSQQLDTQGEAHDALGTAVSSYGQRVLNDPHILGNLVTDLLPDLPRERSLLVTGADAGIAAQMTQHVEEQHIDPDTAVQLVARALSERRAIDQAASMWVVTEYAQALGYRVRPYAEAAGPPSRRPFRCRASHPGRRPGRRRSGRRANLQPARSSSPGSRPDPRAVLAAGRAAAAVLAAGRAAARAVLAAAPAVFRRPRTPGTAGNAASSPPGPRRGWSSFSSSSPRSRASPVQQVPPRGLVPSHSARSHADHAPRRRPRRRPWPPVSPPSHSCCRVISATRRHSARLNRPPPYSWSMPGRSRPCPAMPACRMGT